MRYLRSVIFLLLINGAANAQTNANSLNDSLIARYNRGDYQGFYKLGSVNWRENKKENDIVGQLNYMKDQTGLVISSAIRQASGDSINFLWNGQKEMVSFGMKYSKGDTFNNFNFGPYHFPPFDPLFQSVPTDNPMKTHLDSCVQAITANFMITHKLIGLSIGLIRNGKKYTYNYGTIEKGKKQLPTAHTTFELASITKTFTGILLAQAVLDRKLSLSDDIRKYMDGDYPNLQYMGKPIRVVDLSNHTSRIPGMLPDLDAYKSEFEVIKMYDHYTTDKFLADLHQVKIDTLPGTVYSYSNTGVKLLGIILEKVYAKNYQELLKKYICEPMNMKYTRTAAAISDTTGYIRGYNGFGNPMPHLNFNMFGGAGGVLSTTDDMLNYLQQNITGKMPAVKLSHQQTFINNNEDRMGMCWQIRQTTINGTCIWKSGGALGFRSYCAFVPEKKVGIIWLSNRGDLMEDELTEIGDQLLKDALSTK